MAYQCRLNEFVFFIERLYSIVLCCVLKERFNPGKVCWKLASNFLSLSLFSIHSLSFSLSFHFFSPGAQCLDSDKVKAVQIICQQVNYIGMPVAELWAEVKPGARTCPRKHCRSGLPEDKARSRASHEIRHTCGQAVLSPYIGLALNAQLGGCNMVYFDDGHFLSQRGPGM